MAEELTNPLTSLLKKKYGIAAPSNVLRFTDKDTLFTAWRKTAQFIYKNGEWSDQDFQNSVKLEYDGSRKFENIDSVEPADDSEELNRVKYVVAERTNGKSTVDDLKMYLVKGTAKDGKPYSEYFAMD